MALRVKAKAMGFRDGRRVRQGEEFVIPDGATVPKWVEVLGGEEPKKTRRAKVVTEPEPEGEVVQSESVI